MKVITFSRFFPANHPKKGQPTHFVEKIWQSIEEDFSKTIIGLDEELKHFVNIFHYPKYHTIRAGNRWKVGEKFSPRIWSGLPYRSKQIEFAPPIEIKKVWDVEICGDGLRKTIGIIEPKSEYRKLIPLANVAKNDGLSNEDFISWFPKDGTFQILCWNESINYLNE